MYFADTYKELNELLNMLKARKYQSDQTVIYALERLLLAMADATSVLSKYNASTRNVALSPRTRLPSRRRITQRVEHLLDSLVRASLQVRLNSIVETHKIVTVQVSAKMLISALEREDSCTPVLLPELTTTQRYPANDTLTRIHQLQNKRAQ